MRHENDELRNAREVAEKNYHIIMNDNNALQIKLENLGKSIIKKKRMKDNDICYSIHFSNIFILKREYSSETQFRREIMARISLGKII